MKRSVSIVLLLCLSLGGCLSTRRTDRLVQREVRRRVDADPYLSANVVEDALIDGPEERPPAPDVLTLESSLQIGTKHSRTLQNQRDRLYRDIVSLLGVRRNFGVNLAGTVSYVLSEDGDGAQDESADLALSASRILPTGGDVSLSGDTGMDRSTDTNGVSSDVYGSSVRLRVDQPLLAGAGYGISHENLTQAQRSLVYALRSFGLQRQDIAISSLEGFYALLLQRSVLENTRTNVGQSRRLRERSEALFSVNRAPAIDVLRAQQQELSASNQLNRAEADYDGQIRRYLLSLGLSVEERAVIRGEVPGVTPLLADESACVMRALEYRLDLQTVADRVDDAERRLRQSKSWLRPDLDVYGTVTLSDSGAESFGDQELEEQYQAGVTLELPIDKRDERDAVKLARLDLEAAQRALEQKRDEVRLEVIDSFTRLDFLAGSVSIERQNIEIAERRARNAMLRFRNGELLNRDVVEAENELLAARNAYARVSVSYEVQRIKLLRNIGALDVRPDGTILELEISKQ
ncbi:MAG: TolC family protein [Kiritimatiellae bacterium]|nr:TolC family protein [Kiritimatiellia bacterium]